MYIKEEICGGRVVLATLTLCIKHTVLLGSPDFKKGRGSGLRKQNDSLENWRDAGCILARRAAVCGR